MFYEYLQFWETKSCLEVALVVYYILRLNVESLEQPKLKNFIPHRLHSTKHMDVVLPAFINSFRCWMIEVVLTFED